MVVGKILKDKVWRFVEYPKHLEFESISFANMKWSWNEEFSILINNSYGIIMKINKDDMFRVLSNQQYLSYVNHIMLSIRIENKNLIECFSTWYNQEWSSL